MYNKKVPFVGKGLVTTKWNPYVFTSISLTTPDVVYLANDGIERVTGVKSLELLMLVRFQEWILRYRSLSIVAFAILSSPNIYITAMILYRVCVVYVFISTGICVSFYAFFEIVECRSLDSNYIMENVCALFGWIRERIMGKDDLIWKILNRILSDRNWTKLHI